MSFRAVCVCSLTSGMWTHLLTRHSLTLAQGFFHISCLHSKVQLLLLQQFQSLLTDLSCFVHQLHLALFQQLLTIYAQWAVIQWKTQTSWLTNNNCWTEQQQQQEGAWSPFLLTCRSGAMKSASIICSMRASSCCSSTMMSPTAVVVSYNKVKLW